MKMYLLLLCFTASVSAATKFVLIGDTGKNNDGQLRVSEALKAHCVAQGCDFGMLAGDNIYPAGVSSPEDPILETMFDKFYNGLGIPFLVSLGNHDYGKRSNDWIRGSYQIQHGKKNPLFFLPDYYYSYETPESVIAVLDTSRLMWKKEMEEQAQMVKSAFEKARTEKKWFLVLGHHPYLSNGKHGNAGNYERVPFPHFVSGTFVKSFIEENVCGKAHFYLSGHDHSLQVIDGNVEGCNTKLVISGTGASATKLYPRNLVQFESTQLGFFALEITHQDVLLKAINDRSEVLYQLRLTAPAN